VRPSRTPLRDRWASARRRWCKPSALKPTLQRAGSRERLHALQPQIDANEARSPARVILAQLRGGLVRRVVRRWQWAGESVTLGGEAVRSFLAPPLEQGAYGARRYVERKAQVRGGRTLPMTMPHGTPNRQRNGCRHGSTSLRVYPYVSMRDPESVQKNPRRGELGVSLFPANRPGWRHIVPPALEVARQTRDVAISGEPSRAEATVLFWSMHARGKTACRN
jgi:hypothetical protein